MSLEKEYDIIIFGATGYTGKYILKNVVKSSKIENSKWKFAVAGRDENKLKEAVNEISLQLDQNLDHVGIIKANVRDEQSLFEMCNKGKLILNAVGPYVLYGEPVVKACIQAKTHMVDITGEPQYMEKMQLEYHKKAEEAGIYIISACGFDSIPFELGMNFLQSKFKPRVLNSVEAYIETIVNKNDYQFNHGTWDSAINILSRISELKPLRKRLYSTFFTKKWPEIKYPCRKRYIPFYLPELNKWSIPFIDLNESSVKRSQLHEYQENNIPPIQFKEYFVIPNLMYSVFYILLGIMLLIFVPFKFGRKLLYNYPHIFSLGMFSKEGPTKKQVENSSFKVTLIGKGWSNQLNDNENYYDHPPDTKIVGVVNGPDMAYEATSIFLILSGITILLEKDKIPFNGGVLTPGFAFKQTSIIDRLSKYSIHFNIITEIS